MLPDGKSDGLGTQGDHAAKNGVILRRFRVKEPRHSEIIFAKTRYTSIVSRVRQVQHEPTSTSTPLQKHSRGDGRHKQAHQRIRPTERAHPILRTFCAPNTRSSTSHQNKMAFKAFARAIRPAFLCANPKANTCSYCYRSSR